MPFPWWAAYEVASIIIGGHQERVFARLETRESRAITINVNVNVRPLRSRLIFYQKRLTIQGLYFSSFILDAFLGPGREIGTFGSWAQVLLLLTIGRRRRDATWRLDHELERRNCATLAADRGYSMERNGEDNHGRR